MELWFKHFKMSGFYFSLVHLILSKICDTSFRFHSWMFSATIIAAISEFHRQLWQQKHPHLHEVLTMWAIFDSPLSCGIQYVYTVHQHQTLLLVLSLSISFFCISAPFDIMTFVQHVTLTIQPIFTTWCQSWPTASSPKCGQHTVLQQYIILKCITTTHHFKVYYNIADVFIDFHVTLDQQFSALSCVALFPRRTKPSLNFFQLLLHN